MKHKLAVFAAVCAIPVLLLASQQMIDAAKYSLRLCVELIIPSLFPFFVLTILLNRMGLSHMINTGHSGVCLTALIIGLTGGYPMGAVYVAGMVERGVIDDDEGASLLTFCNNSGPAFIVGAVGAGVFKSVAAGLLLYASHVASAMIIFLLRRRKIKHTAADGNVRFESFIRAFPSSVKDAVTAVLNVCGFAVCFSVFSAMLDVNGLLSSAVGRLSLFFDMPLTWVRAFIVGTLELSSGLGLMRGFELCPANLVLASLLIGWGGISVHFQTMAVIADTKIKGAPHTAGRLMSALLSSALTYAFSLIFFRS